ncbi:MAG: hypothetical protein GY867_02265 [bacterium]|nr:hypothetical protein [bacterium]
MILQARLITRIALFAALIYVLAWATAPLLNVKLSFFLAFAAGFLWGFFPGLLAGGIGQWLWTFFNPYGPATPWVMIAQVAGMAACGLLGRMFRRYILAAPSRITKIAVLVLAAASCTLAFFIPVSLVDAWVYQPFWPRFIGGLPFVAISLAGNLFIFPLLFGVVLHLYERERARL